jgi:CheY-like chemotaxis protein
MSEHIKPLALLIDDEDDLRRIAGLALQLDGWEVLDANNGRMGLRLARERRPQLIVCDVMMPEMSGIEFCHKLAGDLKIKDVPVVLISAVSEKARILNDFWSLPLERKNFLHKPFSTEDLLKSIRAILPPGIELKPGRRAAQGDERPIARTAQETPPAGPPTPPPWMAPKPFPAATPAPPTAMRTPTPAPTPAPEEHRRGYRILVIDDDDDIRMILKTALGMYHTIQEAENGMEGLRALEAFAPDFVITDINMPVMNGLETAEAIRRHPTLCNVPIFFLTGETDTNLPRKAFGVGGNLYLRKPVDPGRLLKYIDYFLKETGLEPGEHGVKPQTAPPVNAPEPARPAALRAVRILTVDFNIEDHKVLKRYFGEHGNPLVEGGPFELLWAEDPRTALGNLARWEPDLILYNPRNPNLDGVAFSQTLHLQKEAAKQQIAFVGTRFYDADIQYSQRQWQRLPISLDAPEEAVAQKLSDAVAAARPRLREKTFTLRALDQAEVERLRQLQATSARRARERETFRGRYANIQAFIDKQF